MTTRSTRASRMSGASGSFGVTRYQWPRIIAAKTPPMAAVTTASWVRSETVPIAPPPHARAPATSVAAAAARAAHSRAAPGRGRMRRATRRDRRQRAEGDERRPARRIPGRVGHDRGAPGLVGQGAVGQPGEDPEPDRAGGREAEVAAGRVGPPPEQDHGRVRSEGEAGQHGPVDEGEVLGDLRGGHEAECTGRVPERRERSRRRSQRFYDAREGGRHDPRPRHDVHLVRPLLRRSPDARRQGHPHRSVVRQPALATDGRLRRGVRPAAGHPRPLRPHGRGGRPREPAPTRPGRACTR